MNTNKPAERDGLTPQPRTNPGDRLLVISHRTLEK